MSGNFEQSNMAAQNQNQMVNQQQVPTTVQNVQNQAPIPQPPPQEPSPPPNRPRNIFDELLESSEDIFARLIAKEEMIGCCDKDEIHVGVEHSVNKFIQKAQVVELFFNQRIAKVNIFFINLGADPSYGPEKAFIESRFRIQSLGNGKD